LIDPNRLKQILINLVQNAIKFSPKNREVTIIPVLEKLPGNEVKIKLKVRDKGIGITTDDLENIFTKFFRSKNPLNKSMNPYGNGIGLSVSKKIAEAFNGKLSVESTSRHGTTFVL
jgi:signal transduction histidine kinase